MTLKGIEEPKVIKIGVKPNIFSTAFGVLGFAMSIYTDKASKSETLHIREMNRCLLLLNPTYIYFDPYYRTHLFQKMQPLGT